MRLCDLGDHKARMLWTDSMIRNADEVGHSVIRTALLNGLPCRGTLHGGKCRTCDVDLLSDGNDLRTRPCNGSKERRHFVGMPLILAPQILFAEAAASITAQAAKVVELGDLSLAEHDEPLFRKRLVAVDQVLNCADRAIGLE